MAKAAAKGRPRWLRRRRHPRFLELFRRLGRILDGLVKLLAQGDAWTFSSLAKAASVPERTVYRYFATREALLEALFEHANRRIGFHGDLPTDAAELTALVRRCFPGFDGIAPLVRELLLAPEGKLARLRQKSARQRASLSLVAREAPGLEPTQARRLAAVLQLLGQATTWQTLRDYWDMDGAEAAEAAAFAIQLLLAGARRAPAKVSRRTRVRKTKERA